MKYSTPIGFLPLLITALAIQNQVAAADPPDAGWAPAKGPVMTRWAKDVSPANAHPEYPRPQLVRAGWLNLNGLWQLEPGKAVNAMWRTSATAC